ncbi:flagellin [Methanocaldococcus infernus ME]|uniref:Flagellin n=1 Tax=Methanocaldococcus infernus (strain DSM 11812 / JCM 15783 / ME) TaxID=573063 RepID=D5VT60_METIM|nr:flagellin [Methanocaldococcus infernus]ADG13763.1 flagellin [Methanocaldococcus infernus ME]
MKFFSSKKGAIGIGTLIIFIALVLVAAIAAAVIINTAANLQQKAARVGQESTKQVASGIQVVKVVGYAPNNNEITKLLIFVSPNIGDEIDLSSTIVTLSNGEKKCSLVYDSAAYVNDPAIQGTEDLFNGDNVQTAWTYSGGDRFGVIILQDADGSCNDSAHPTINFGDKVALTVDLNAIGMPIKPRDLIEGEVIPEYGSPGIIEFYAPSTFNRRVIELQ